MSRPALKLAERFSYRDYVTWPANERWELIHGEAYDMSPAPSPEHQRVLLELAAEFRNFLRGKPCQVYIAPFDVRLPERNECDDELDTVVQPDISIICDHAKIDRKGCRGAPDLIVEVLSPATARKDLTEKLNLYEQHGVPEYWIVYPFDQMLTVFTLTDGAYSKPMIYSNGERVSVGVLPGLEIDLHEIFGDSQEM